MLMNATKITLTLLLLYFVFELYLSLKANLQHNYITNKSNEPTR